MSTHVRNTCRSEFYHLRQLRLIRRHLTDKTVSTLVHASVLARIDYCNTVLVVSTKQLQNRLQMVLNTAARLLLQIPKFGHISSASMNTLHWLPVLDRLICCQIALYVVSHGAMLWMLVCFISAPGRRWAWGEYCVPRPARF